MIRKRGLIVLVLALLLLSSKMVVAQSSANYTVQRFAIVGGGAADSASYAVTSAIGQPATEFVTGPSYKVSGGFLFPRQQASFTVGGTVSGLTGEGLVLQNNGGDNLPITTNGSFTFGAELANGSAYAVTVATQPTNPTQSCSVTNGTGTVNGSNVANVAVNCITGNFSVGGTVSGLTGEGLVLRNNGGDSLSIATNGGFAFATGLDNGSAYAVTVATQPTNPTQNCTVTNGTGTVSGSNVTNVAINCITGKFSVGGTVSGLTGEGLVLQNNGGNNLSIATNGSFAFATGLDNGSAYAVTVATQPTNPTQSCTVTNGTGTVSGSNVTNINVTCTTASLPQLHLPNIQR